MKSRRLKPDLVLIGVTVLWASTFTATKDVVRTAPPLAYLTFRFGLAALCLGALYGRRLARPGAALRDGIVVGTLQALGLGVQVLGQVYTTASKSAFLTSLNTPLTPIVALVLYGTRPTRAQRAAVLIASLGLFLLTYPGVGAHFNAGDLYTLACAGFYAVVIVETARRAPRSDIMTFTTVIVITAALLFASALAIAHVLLALPGASTAHFALLALESRPLVLSPRLVAEVLYLSLICTLLTFSAQNWAMARMSATAAAIVFALEPVFATLMALAVYGRAEWPGARGVAGAALVLAAVFVSEVRAPRWLRSTSASRRA